MALDLAGNRINSELLLKIARCPIVERCLNGETGHGCSKIVLSQGADSTSEFQSPEPWSGHLSLAPILFLSSNPSIGPAAYDQYPRATWDDEPIIESFEYRFGGRPRSSIEQGIYHASPASPRGRRGVKFWIAVRARAAEILEKPTSQLVPGTDYALSEVVRCKSRDEVGVAEALATCVREYLEPTLEASVASLIVVLGAQARRVISDRYGLESGVLVHGPLQVASRLRQIAFLPHPSGRAPRKTFSGCLDPSDVKRLKQWLGTPEA